MRKRKIKFPLLLKNDIKVRTLEDLQLNFDLNKILAYYENGKLAIWLKDRYEDDIAEEIEALDRTSADAAKKICEILGVSSENVSGISLDTISKKNKKLERVMQITDDKNIINCFENVAFDQEELNTLMNSGVTTIYLYGSDFTITPPNHIIRFVGINTPEISFGSHKKKEYTDAGVIFENLALPFSNPFTCLAVGDRIDFGRYNSESITWQILEKTDTSVLIVSEKGFEKRVVNPNFVAVKLNDTDNTFSNDHTYLTAAAKAITVAIGQFDFYSTELFNWLNTDFYNSSFDEDEKEIISLHQDNNITLLSVDEVKKYFPNQNSRKIGGSWWTRSTGEGSTSYGYVNSMGEIIIRGAPRTTAMLIRPAIWININE